jgi:hypothetical protein
VAVPVIVVAVLEIEMGVTETAVMNDIHTVHCSMDTVPAPVQADPHPYKYSDIADSPAARS